MIAWRKFDETGTYKAKTSEKLDKRLLKLAKTLGVCEEDEQ